MRFAVPAVLLALLLGLFVLGMDRDPTLVPSPLIGQAAPEFELPSLDGRAPVSMADLRGQTFLLNVWGTWCPGCRQEHDYLISLSRSGGIPIVGLNWKDDTRLAREWLNSLGNPYRQVAVDQDGRVAIDWGVYGAPETFLVDAAGIVRHRHVGPLSQEIWDQSFAPLLAGLEP